MPAGQPETARSHTARWSIGTSCLLLMVSAAILVGRRANFDEWLLLRASWLISAGIEGNIPFLMPITAMLGPILSAGWLPSELFLALRIAAITLVGLSLLFAVQRNTPDRITATLALALTLSCGAFFSHGFELRYDLVILCGWLLAWGIVARPGRHAALALGMLAALLAAHHTKGLFYAVWLMPAACLLPGPRWKQGLLFAAGASALGLTWLAWLLDRDALGEASQVYRKFAALSLEQARVSAWDSLAPRLAVDWVWWAIAGGALLSRLMRQRLSLAFGSVWMSLAPVAFITLHPHPWDYLLAPVVPFVATLAAIELRHGLARLPRPSARLAQVACLLGAVAMASPSAWHTWQARAAPDLKVIDLSVQGLLTTDRVTDPSGALFAAAPVNTNWYRDTLWQGASLTGGPNDSDWAQATFIIRSHRLKWVDAEWQLKLERSHVPGCGWLWVRKNDPRLPTFRSACPPDVAASLNNYWERAN